MKYKNNITGILPINKPSGCTSRDVVNTVQKLLNTKVGHTGTLDPIATGVLVLTLGKATKLNELLVSSSKEYICQMRLGMETDTLDITGNKIFENNAKISKEQIIDALNHFKGTYLQEVPKYSAVKVNGKKLYEYAREDKEVILPKKEVIIYDIKLVKYSENDITFKANVSKGTYIRSLVRDIAYYLNTYGTMVSLQRTKQGKFTLESAYTLDQIKNKDYKIIDIKDALDIDICKVNNIDKNKILNGMKMNYKYEKVLFVDKDGRELAIYKNENGLRMWKMLYENNG